MNILRLSHVAANHKIHIIQLMPNKRERKRTDNPPRNLNYYGRLMNVMNANEWKF